MKVTAVFALLYGVVFLLSGLAISAPYATSFAWTYAGTTMPTVHTGFLFGDRDDYRWTFHWLWCESIGYSDTTGTCNRLRVAWLVASLLWGVHLILVPTVVGCLFVRPRIATLLGPLCFVFQMCGGFCFVMRVTSLHQEVLQFYGATVGVEWSLGWSGGVAIAAASVNFVVTLLLGLLQQRVHDAVERPLEEDLPRSEVAKDVTRSEPIEAPGDPAPCSPTPVHSSMADLYGAGSRQTGNRPTRTPEVFHHADARHTTSRRSDYVRSSHRDSGTRRRGTSPYSRRHE